MLMKKFLMLNLKKINNMKYQESYIICPTCHTLNKFAQDKLANKPKCGKCSNYLFLGKPVKLNDSSFLKFVQKTTIPVVVDFWAEWCGPCKIMAPIFEQAAKNMEPTVMFGKLNTEEAPLTAREYGIRSIPTIAILEHGKVIAQRAGTMNLPDLTAWIQQSI
jgi:thioredoxin 2